MLARLCGLQIEKMILAKFRLACAVTQFRFIMFIGGIFSRNQNILFKGVLRPLLESIKEEVSFLK